MEIHFSGKRDMTRARNVPDPWNRLDAHAFRWGCQPHRKRGLLHHATGCEI